MTKDGFCEIPREYALYLTDKRNELCKCDYLIVFDYEALLKKITHWESDNTTRVEFERSEKTRIISEHIPISLAIASNITGYEEIVKRDQNAKITKNGNQFKSIKTNRLIFLDQMLYCAAGKSLREFIISMTGQDLKFFWPYEWFDNYKKLKLPISVLTRAD